MSREYKVFWISAIIIMVFYIGAIIYNVFFKKEKKKDS